MPEPKRSTVDGSGTVGVAAILVLGVNPVAVIVKLVLVGIPVPPSRVKSSVVVVPETPPKNGPPFPPAGRGWAGKLKWKSTNVNPVPLWKAAGPKLPAGLVFKPNVSRFGRLV